MKKLRYILALLLLTVTILPAFAQLPDRKFRVMDATGEQWSSKEFVDGQIEPGVNEFKGASTEGLKVYVMFTAGADSLIKYTRGNENLNKLNDYIRYYEQKTYLLKPDREGTFTLSDANWIAEELYRDFKNLIDYWIANSDESLTPYSIALVIYHEEKGQYEKHDIEPIINNLSTDPRACIYYKGEKVMEEQVTSAKMKTGKIRKSTIVKGAFLPIAENINAQGPSNMRLVIDRVVRPCTFQEDLHRVQRDFRGNQPAQDIALRLLGHAEDADSIYRQMPFVFAGADFQKSLYRRTAGVLRRDTMEFYRQETNLRLASQMGARDYKVVDPDTIVFELDHSLWNTACMYDDFKDIRDKMVSFARKQRVDLPADGGKPLELGESKMYTLEVDSALFNSLTRYVDRGHKIAAARRRESASQIIPGWISPYTDVVPNASDSVYYRVANSSVLALERPKFLEMELAGHATIIEANKRDSVYRVRINSQSYMEEFEACFEADTASLKAVNIFLTDKPNKTTYNWEFHMPDVQKYYKMEHINYYHDFIHVDTTTTEECPCDRATPLMFLSIGSGAASFDCPPFMQGSTKEDDFKPIPSNREEHTVDKSSRLQFGRGSAHIDRSLGVNDSLLNELAATIDDILWMDTEDGMGARRRIDSVKIIGISSPEGGYSRNKALAADRARSFGNWIYSEISKMGGQNPRLISSGDVAPWDSVASYLWEKDSVEYADICNRIREACTAQGGVINDNSMAAIQGAIGFRSGDPVIEEALATLRKTEVRFYYVDVTDPTEKMVMAAYRDHKWDQMDAYHYWVLLHSENLSKDQKLELSRYVLKLKENRVKNFTRNVRYRNFDDFFDLVLPLAATMLVTDSIDLKIFNTDVLRPFLDPASRSLRGNEAYTTTFRGETKIWKYINLDFMLYNQILSLLGKGDQESLREADVLIQFLNQSPTTTPKFDDHYKRKALSDYLKCYTSDFLTDDALAQSIASSSVVNFFIVNMDIAHQLLQQDGGTYTNERERQCFKDCYNRIGALKEEGEKIPAYLTASYYFTAVAEMRYAEAFADAEAKKGHFARAVEALVALFKSDENATFISRCQGDSYVRGVYATPAKMNQGVDLYLDAVEQYIKEQVSPKREEPAAAENNEQVNN